MDRFPLIAFSVALVVFGPAGVGAVQEAGQKELDRLQGTWEQVSVESNGMTTGFLKSTAPRLSLRGDRYTMEAGGKVVESGTWKVGPAAKPAVFDLVATEGATKDRTYFGIYELKGDELRTCIARTGGNRPTEFTAGSGSGRAVAVYRRLSPSK